VQILNGYADRHCDPPLRGRRGEACCRHLPGPIINAGDGAGQHPTQALLDLYTIARK